MDIVINYSHNCLDLRRRLLLRMALLFFTACSLAACGQGETVAISKEAPSVSYREVPAGKLMAKVTIDNYGKTNWTFHCYTKFDYALETNEKQGAQYLVKLRITRVNMKISLPMEVITYAHPARSLLDHENGHVQICRQIYENALGVAKQAGESALGQVFQGTAATPEVATAIALDNAAEFVGARYRAQTSDLAERVSNRYDFDCANNATIDSAMKDAFASQSGK